MGRKIPTGSLFQRPYIDRAGKRQKTATWHMKYYVRGKVVQVSTGTENYDEALEMLRKRLAGAGAEAHVLQPERVKIGQLLDLLIEDYRYKAHKSLYDTELRVNAHLRKHFGTMKAQALTTTAIKSYVAHRRRQQAEPATVNKELSWLRRAMNLGKRHDPPLVVHVPAFEMLPIDNAREGTLEYESYRCVRDLLPPYARLALVIAYHTGARKGEIRSIKRAAVDLRAARIHLASRSTKSGKPRYLPIYGDMGAEIEMALSKCEACCPFLLQREGKPVFDFEKAWATACETAGVQGALFHDLRRTALTNMIEAGLSEKEAMEISGHKTRAVFDRYHIVSERRMRQNASKLEAHLQAKASQLTVTDDGDRQILKPN